MLLLRSGGALLLRRRRRPWVGVNLEGCLEGASSLGLFRAAALLHLLLLLLHLLLLLLLLLGGVRGEEFNGFCAPRREEPTENRRGTRGADLEVRTKGSRASGGRGEVHEG